jgi:hypothetical protein
MASSVLLWLAALPPLILVLVGLAGKYYFDHEIRKEVVGPAVQRLTPAHLALYYNRTKVLCVGCTKGIGQAAAQAACAHGAFVVVVGRSTPNQFLDSCKGPSEFIKADLSLMRNGKIVVERLASYGFNTVLFTTGIISGPTRETSDEGVEMDTAVSFLSRFVMARLLTSATEPRLKAVSPARKPRIFIMGFSGDNTVPQVLLCLAWDVFVPSPLKRAQREHR